ncbi:ent-kaurene oxidase [Diplodia corticola]|uniref:Ent-kaurene oxidase n=1 Tax=Diplodia corticola TaxID=236234 RepID=A0A1J9R0K4_9PEZI|nr:ent-kaurene oxidase [Diplodia corticola]OJD34129.1 ent-kaurene oxidase [Diplodia corticola]
MASPSNVSFLHDPLFLARRDLHVEMPGFVLDNVRLLFFTSTPAVLASIIAAAAAVTAAVVWTRDPLAAFSVIGQEWGDENKRRERFVMDAKKIYLEGYKKFKDGVYQITTVRRSKTIVIAPKFLDELRKLPDDVVCNQCAADETLESKYTNLNTHEPLHGHVMKTLLTPNLRRLNPRIAETITITTAIHLRLPASTTTWSPLNATTPLLHIVAAATGAIGVGTPLCLDQTYLDASVQYASSVMRAMAAASRVPWWARWLVAPWLRECREVRVRERDVGALVGGLVRERRMKEGKKGDGEGDMLGWFVESGARFGVDEEWKVVRAYLGFVFAAVHSTTVVVVNVLFNLAAMPDFTTELREEITTVLARHDGVMTFQALQEMTKLDSFMKETLRLYPLQFANFQRKVLKPFALSTGPVIPAHTVIEVPSMAVSLDPARFPDPTRFDPLRFHRLRTAPAADPSKHQFATVAEDSTNFGWGRHACPGRFFAANEIKMVVAAVVRGWDVKMPEAGEGEGEAEREWEGRRWRNWEYGNFKYRTPRANLARWFSFPSLFANVHRRLADCSRVVDGMDPISTFSLAAGVIQVVDYGTRVLSTTYQIYQSGSGQTTRDVELSSLSQDLSDLSERLKKRPSGTPENALLHLCDRCVEASDELQRAIDALRARGTTRISVAASSLVSALKSIWTEDKIGRLRDRLSEIRSQMTIATLVSVWEETQLDSQRHVELRDRLDEIAEKLDRRDTSAHRFAIELKGMTSQDEESQSSRKNHELVRIIWNTDRSFWALNQSGQQFNAPQSVDRSSYDDVPVAAKVLSNLWYSDMESRGEAIPNAYADTFEWIFRDEHVDEHGQELKWSSFPAWLRQDSRSIYWITGKPGSGKSTLMKFIFEHEQLRRHLQDYAKDLPLMLAGFFFWNPGSKMQKSHEGLIRALLHQCLTVRRDLISVVLPRRWALYSLLGHDSTAPDWSWGELKESFEILCSYHGKEFQLALFLDGLDEFDGTHVDLIQWAKDNIACRDIKLCVSSRPWNIFSDAFGQGHSLTMQDLTRRDIEHFVKAEFDNSPAFQDLRGIYELETNRLLSEITRKAQGVFLWVNLVVRSLLETLTDSPSLSHVEAVLAEIPADIAGLYNSIWRSIPTERLPTSSKLFQLCVIQDPNEHHVTVEMFWRATEGSFAKSRPVAMDENARKRITNVMKRLLDGHTRGILEISSNQVQFLHRSARDWITDAGIWGEICSKAPADFDPHMDLLEAYLAQPPTVIGSETDLLSGFVHKFLFYARGASKSIKVTEDRLVQALDRANELACDLSVASPHITRKLSVDSTHPDRDEYSLRHWSTVQYFNIDKENSFVGIAAQYGVFKYVQAKVSANRRLLESKPNRVSLLENAVFPGLTSIQLHTRYGLYDILPQGSVGEEQARIVRFLLDASSAHYRTAFGRSLYDTLLEVQGAKRVSMMMPISPEWYVEARKILEEYGYGHEAARPEIARPEAARPEAAMLEVAKPEVAKIVKAKKLGRLLRRMRTKLVN